MHNPGGKNNLYLFSKGARVWIPHPLNIWQEARVVENFVKDILKVATEDGEVREIVIKKEENLPPLRNPDILIGENDLTSLSYLHEPAVLHNLQVRFCRHNAIYTYCGIVLVAINPYMEMPIYGADTLWTYRGQTMGDLEPHIFAVAEEAYTKMEREQSDQSIIVSGESGAGKTVSAKYAMRYFAMVGGSTSETHVEKKVLASSPIMEAIGNAKTIRNDNSSRFGKYIELHCSKTYTIVGASMRTYLLEKSRVVSQGMGERNYHVFYQACAARERHKNLYLDVPESFIYLNKDVHITGVDDLAAYEETLSAMTTLGFSSSDCEDIFLVLALILHLGNISIQDSDKNADLSSIRADDRHLQILSHIGHFDGAELARCLCNRQITSLRETINKPMNTSEAQFARDALAKHIYAQLFAWIVERINRGLKTANEAKHKFIGVLDIYGFETFEINSFEQFCINYANEKLQQQFNLHVFKLEQEEYLKEGIEWKFIDFYDNQPCIDLIESKLGILDLLDEECRMPKGSDSSWALKLFEKCGKSAHFTKARFGTNSFVIKHFADLVDYEVNGFLEKNRDTVLEDQLEILRNSGNRLVQRLFSSESDDKLNVPKPKVRLSIAPAAKPVSAKNNKKTVGSQFRDSLNALMTSLNATTPHYIRCIKPNDEKAAFKFNSSRAVQQLRACGVLETIRISAAGFPSRWLYCDFMKRYRALCKSKDINRNNLELTCQKLLQSVIKQEDKYKFGKTKIFFRAGQVAYLERLRSDKLLACCVRIQTCVRGFLVRRRYTKTLKATNTLQRYCRGFLARRRAEGIRRNKAAAIIQKYYRKYVARTKYLQIRKAALGIQTRGRGFLARKKYQEMRYNHAAILIQKTVRGWLCRRRYKKSMRSLVIAQSAIRRFIARKQYKKLKIEARSVEHMKKLNKGLENKIFSLQQKIEDIMKENSSMKQSVNELNDIKVRLDTLRGVDIKFKNAIKELKDRDNLVEQLREEITNLRNSLSQKEKKDAEMQIETEAIKKANELFSEQVNQLQDELKKTKYGFEEELKTRLSQEQAHLKEEYGLERVAHQKLLQERDDLESRVEVLESQLSRSGGSNRWTHRRAPSDASTVSAEDIGYGSVAASNRDDSSLAPSTRDDSSTPESHPVDVSLVLRLQQKIKFMENDYQRLNNKFEAHQAMYNSHLFHHRTSGDGDSIDDLKVQELEIENSKLHADLIALRECIARDSSNMGNTTIEELVRQLEWRTGEVERLREENVQLRSAFSGKLKSAKALAESAYSSCRDIDTSVINEDGELVLAFEAQKKILRQLEDELQKKSMDWKDERDDLIRELDRVRCENEKLQGLLAADLPHIGQHSQNDAYLQYEVARITSDYLELQEKYNNKSAKCHKLQDQNSHLIRRLKDAGVIDPDSKNASLVVADKMSPDRMPVVKKKDREYMGMFECKADDINVLIRHLLELKPPIAITMLPALPAYILFMCIRYTDHINDVPSLQSLVLIYNKSIPKLLKKKPEDVDLSVLWLSNTMRLLHSLKQYSGEKHFATENTHTQNEQCLKNFDLAEFRQLLSDQVLWIFQFVLKNLEDKIQPLAVPAILEHEVIPGLTLSGSRPRSSSVSAANISTKKILDDLIFHLTAFYRMLNLHGVDSELIVQFFKHIFYFLCAHSLNNLLLRREYCNWSKGLQIRYNLSHLEQWARDIKLQDAKIVEMLAPLIQASQLLQGRKTENDIDALADMCKNLTYNQIIKLLNLYTPEDGYEFEMMPQFIEKFAEKLKLQRKSIEGSLLMDAKMFFPIEIPYNPSNIRLEEIEIPQILNLPMLKRI